ncbi:hypothetical protein K435DRAFT_858024 [Dendrothele bispora CBS 962.96]|uniref:Uncharacterized protein n=1 Tax=Dendrothele bispora (strain CBS 962.96) TaxID=1314807 RepID=A0A4S8M5E3_DENBC|nr:hypothetical protein K435DRAFT_858024 [Dendrothele bispora CBS 962.96]
MMKIDLKIFLTLVLMIQIMKKLPQVTMKWKSVSAQVTYYSELSKTFYFPLNSSSSDMTQASDFAESDSDMMDVDPPVMPQSFGLLQSPAAFSNAYADLMDVDN